MASRKKQLAAGCWLRRTLSGPLMAWAMAGLAAGPAAAQSSEATRVSQDGQYIVRGLDSANGRLFVEDFADGTGPHRLRESDDWGATFSEDKGLPPGVQSMSKVLMFKSRLYLIGRDTGSGRVGVYSAAPTPGNEPLQWSGPTLRLSRGATVLGTDFNAGSRFLYVGEYGDPKPGPHVYRSADGTHWQTVFGAARGIRHIHGIAADPYRRGQVWMTVGDGVGAVYRSRRYGARGSWRLVVPTSNWQSVQISFTRSRVYLAADTHSRTFFVVNPRTLRPRLGTLQYFASKHPPGSPPGTRYLFNGFFGAVDPNTGVYYCVANDDSEGSTGGSSWQGFFAVRGLGAPVSILDPGGQAISMNGEVFVGGGRIWSGQWSVAALGSTATGIRTPVSAVRGRRPSPLDDGGLGGRF